MSFCYLSAFSFSSFSLSLCISIALGSLLLLYTHTLFFSSSFRLPDSSSNILLHICLLWRLSWKNVTAPNQPNGIFLRFSTWRHTRPVQCVCVCVRVWTSECVSLRVSEILYFYLWIASIHMHYRVLYSFRILWSILIWYTIKRPPPLVLILITISYANLTYQCPLSNAQCPLSNAQWKMKIFLSICIDHFLCPLFPIPRLKSTCVWCAVCSVHALPFEIEKLTKIIHTVKQFKPPSRQKVK